MERNKILIVDDEVEICDLISIYIKNEGYEPIKAKDGLEALEILKKEKIDLIILDIMMPNLNGIDTCIKIRKDNNIPIIMLSAKSEDMDKILGLSTGADDYLTKPFNPLELVARVKSQLRRYKVLNNYANKKENVINIGELEIYLDEHEVKKNDRVIKLTPTEFDILKLLSINKGMVFSAERIYEKVWGDSFFDSANTVMVHIRRLREKIEDNGRNAQYIKTVWGVGYKIE
ncbi:response regulator transcription factor [Hathewaya limosa]|uniref:Stage 0 sporulation protein A homolog n=1 Tax=Hathewaya limosa TaxID=1536 RepID=A0ABU0JQU8_HATLI|nr:response regulator transcription factor [Hathewaya limosa]MDQ0478302.1 DNA-binding response OmpR family regulator [Hathewaya limosa]